MFIKISIKDFYKYTNNFFKKKESMSKKIKKYKVSPDESLCLAVSVVDKPAVESDFIYLNEQKLEKFVGVEGEKRMIYGCALRPDFPIYRNNGEDEYYIEFDKESIDKISKNYFKMGFQSNWTAAHKDEVEGLTITESWIKESMTLDKSIALGLDPSLPVGSWFIGCYCENDDIWKQVKENKFHGFSIEAIVGVEEFESQINKLNKNNNSMEVTNEETFFSKLKSVLSEVFGKESTNIELEEEKPLETIENTPPVEPQEPPKVEEPTPKAVEPKEEEPKAEEPKDEPKQDNHLEELINNLKDEIAALKEMNSGLQDKIKDLGKQPSAKPVNTNAKPSPADTYSAWRETMRNYIN